MNQPVLSISLVVYYPDAADVAATLLALQTAVSVAQVDAILQVVDHTPNKPGLSFFWVRQYWHSALEYYHDASNPGFGAGHNRALARVGHFHLVLNPDLEMAPDALKNALTFMAENPACGLLSPYATWANGQTQYLCKRYPCVFDLLLRGFAPKAIKSLFRRRLAHYEMADKVDGYSVIWDPPIISGCFMLFRGGVFNELGGFDPRYFLYFEDFDLSLRAAEITRIAHVPSVRVVHHGGHASRKGWRHIQLFGRSMLTFYRQHGWCWWS